MARAGAFRRALLVVALLAAGCAHGPRLPRHFVCPARGGPPWVELTTEHFVVASDLKRLEADRLARDLEAVRAWVIAALFPVARPDVRARVRVVAFRTEQELDVFAPPGLRAYFTRNGLGEPVIVMSGEVGGAQRLILAHELTHLVARHVYPRQPRWFGEGLAGLAESITDTAGASFGGLPEHRGRGFKKRHVTVRELLAWDGRSTDARWHDTATVLVHFLATRHGERFADVRARLARAEDPASVWREVFPEWDPAREGGPEALDRALEKHVRARHRGERQIEVRGSADPMARTMSAGEVHAIRLSLTRFARGDPNAGAAERAEVEEALEEDPDHVLGLQVKAALEQLDPLPLARRAVRAHPDDVRALLWLAAAAREAGFEDERFEALRRAAEVAPWSAMAANNLAWNLLLRGNARGALPLAERAAELSPGDPAILDTRAGVLEALGRCTEALETAERALELLPENSSDAARQPWEERAPRLRQECLVARPSD
jgi:Flp pilus assembly protein TadD